MAVVVAAEVDGEFPRPLHRIAHRIAAPVVRAGHFAHVCPTVAVLSCAAVLLAPLARDAVGHVQEGVTHHARQRGAARRQGRHAGGEGNGGSASAAFRSPVLQPVQRGVAAVAIRQGRGVHRAVVGAGPLEALGRKEDQ